MISGPIVDGFYFWRRRSLLKGEIIADNTYHISCSRSTLDISKTWGPGVMDGICIV